jgi:hypothetical protein
MSLSYRLIWFGAWAQGKFSFCCAENVEKPSTNETEEANLY